MTTLTQARARVLRMADDEDGVRHNVDNLYTEIDEALTTGVEQAWAYAVASNRSLFRKESTALTTNASGALSLTSIAPLMPLESVAVYTAGERELVVPVSLSDAPQNALAALNLAICYVPRAALPAAAGDPFVWGESAATAIRTVEALMMCLAAQELLIKLGENNPALLTRETQLRATLKQDLSGPSWSVVPLDAHANVRSGRYGYVRTGVDALQLVYV